MYDTDASGTLEEAEVIEGLMSAGGGQGLGAEVDGGVKLHQVLSQFQSVHSVQ